MNSQVTCYINVNRSETYWDNLCADLEAYAKHAGRKRIQMSDFELLFRR